MSFTGLYAVLSLLGLIVIFGLAYKLKGVKIALIATGIAFVIFAISFVALVYVITRFM